MTVRLDRDGPSSHRTRHDRASDLCSQSMTHFVAATTILAGNPHPLFQEVIAGGYEVRYRESPKEFGLDLDVEITQSGKVVAKAEFHNDYSDGAWCQNVEVHEDHRRKGLANSSYVFAEEYFKKCLHDYWKDTGCQSRRAAHLWDQKDRPFGNCGSAGFPCCAKR